jgi:hypothetical protein
LGALLANVLGGLFATARLLCKTQRIHYDFNCAPRYTVMTERKSRMGLSRLAALDPAPLPRPYERARPGELLHIDSKNLARIERTGHRVSGDPRDHVRGAGLEAAFVAIAQASRIHFVL